MTRREHLRLLLDRVQRELAEEEARIARIEAAKARIDVPDDEECDVIGKGHRGGPRRIPDAYSTDVARVAHAMHAAGNREPWVCDAEAQYQRNRKRASRRRLAS